MSPTSVQLKDTLQPNKDLIGSFYSGKGAEQKVAIYCPSCNAVLLPGTKFCGDCGYATSQNHSHNDSNLSTVYLNEQRAKVAGMPAFAQVSPQLRRPISPELKKEYGKVSCLLVRERMFLTLHCLTFLIANLIGLWSAFTAYNGLVADEVTRGVVAFIPLFFINTVAFGALVPIKGTRREISRLKERMTYLHYQIEYTNLA